MHAHATQHMPHARCRPSRLVLVCSLSGALATGLPAPLSDALAHDALDPRLPAPLTGALSQVPGCAALSAMLSMLLPTPPTAPLPGILAASRVASRVASRAASRATICAASRAAICAASRAAIHRFARLTTCRPRCTGRLWWVSAGGARRQQLGSFASAVPPLWPALATWFGSAAPSAVRIASGTGCAALARAPTPYGRCCCWSLPRAPWRG